MIGRLVAAVRGDPPLQYDGESLRRLRRLILLLV